MALRQFSNSNLFRNILFKPQNLSIIKSIHWDQEFHAFKRRFETPLLQAYAETIERKTKEGHRNGRLIASEERKKNDALLRKQLGVEKRFAQKRMLEWFRTTEELRKNSKIQTRSVYSGFIRHIFEEFSDIATNLDQLEDILDTEAPGLEEAGLGPIPHTSEFWRPPPGASAFELAKGRFEALRMKAQIIMSLKKQAGLPVEWVHEKLASQINSLEKYIAEDSQIVHLLKYQDFPNDLIQHMLRLYGIWIRKEFRLKGDWSQTNIHISPAERIAKQLVENSLNASKVSMKDSELRELEKEAAEALSSRFDPQLLAQMTPADLQMDDPSKPSQSKATGLLVNPYSPGSLTPRDLNLNFLIRKKRELGVKPPIAEITEEEPIEFITFHHEKGEFRTERKQKLVDSKVRFRIKLSTIPLSPLVRARLIALAGLRYNSTEEVLTIVGDKHDNRHHNWIYVKKVFQELLQQSHMVDHRFVPLSDLSTPLSETLAREPFPGPYTPKNEDALWKNYERYHNAFFFEEGHLATPWFEVEGQENLLAFASSSNTPPSPSSSSASPASPQPLPSSYILFRLGSLPEPSEYVVNAEKIEQLRRQLAEL